MSKDKKQPPRPTPAHPRDGSALPPLTDLEEEISLVCLRYFRGEWDLYLDYLGGPRVAAEQRQRELPLVERLKQRDRHTEYLTALLEDEVMATAERLGFDGLYRLWELCLLLNPAADPFGKGGAPDGESEPGPGEPPQSLH